MSKKLKVVSTPIQSLDEAWCDAEAGTAHDVADVETFIKQQLRDRTPDTELDAESERPVSNSAVTAALARVPATGEFVEGEGDGSTGSIQFYNEEGDALFAVEGISAGGSGAGDGAARTLLTLEVPAVIRRGEGATATVGYTNYRTDPEAGRVPTGQQAEELTLTVTAGVEVKFTRTLHGVDCGDSLSIAIPAEALSEGKNIITVTATVTDPDSGERRRPTRSATIKVMALTLTPIFRLTDAGVGLRPTDTLTPGFTVSGTGTKTVTLYIDGEEATSQEVTKSGDTPVYFPLTCGAGSPLAATGRHTIQAVAEAEEQGVTVKSTSYYYEIWRTDSTGAYAPHVSVALSRQDGHIFEADETPALMAEQYADAVIEFTASNQAYSSTEVAVSIDGGAAQQLSVARSTLTAHTVRFMTAGDHTVTLTPNGGDAVTIGAEVEASAFAVEEATAALELRLTASGRSNSEETRETWTPTTGEAPVTIEGVRFTGLDGWDGTALRLRDGGRVTVGYPLFTKDFKRNPLTLELTLRVSRILDPSAVVAECYDETSGIGLRITASEVAYYTGQSVSYTDEDGNTQQRPVKLSSALVEGEWHRVALTFASNATGVLEPRLMCLYLNGDRVAADIYETTFSGVQTEARPLTITSEGAMVEVKGLSVYSRAITDDEALDNTIAGAADIEEMQALYEENDVLDTRGDYDFTRLVQGGRGVIKIVRQPTNSADGPLDDMFATNNKSADFTADIFFYSPFGEEHNFTLRGATIRIQGTSSTLYPVKNIRIYFKKSGTMTGGMVTDDSRWPLRPGAVAVDMICAKADYVDSSMSLNTGGAKLFNRLMADLGCLTPPQAWQADNGQAVTARTAIDGYPVDIFLAPNETATPTYLAQYNLNNEKSGIGAILGMKNVEGYTPTCPIILETLNNSHAACLFQSDATASMFEPAEGETKCEFDSGLEVNYAVDSTGKELKDATFASLTPAAKSAIKTLYKFIRDCAMQGGEPDPDDLSTFVSAKFKAEASAHFDLRWLCAYYHEIWRRAGVDQLAKNMLLTTWDGVKWYPLYYDGDTALGKRNDIFLKYGYNITRTTRDAEADKWAFEGHDSWLWNLLLANFPELMATVANEVSAAQTAKDATDVYIGEQSGHWSTRAFNRSGYTKYIAPAVRDTYGRRWNFLYGLQGANISHRKHFIQNRWRLFDAMYATDAFRDDNISCYIARTAQAGASTVTITAADISSFGYGTNNAPLLGASAVVDADEVATFAVTGAFQINDPVRIYGASRMKALDFGGLASEFNGQLMLQRCTMLRELDLGVEEGSQASLSLRLAFGSELPLRRLNLYGQTHATTNATSEGTLDLSGLSQLEEADLRGCTSVKVLTFAAGAPLKTVKLPSALTTLTLKGHSTLTLAGLEYDSLDSLKSLVIEDCPELDFVGLLADCPALERLRVNGIDIIASKMWLEPFRSLGGYEADGAESEKCALVGRVYLNEYLDDEELAELRADFPGLSIVNRAWTVVKIDESVAEPASISNLDNRTGYDYDNDYEPSGHVAALLAARHRVGMKVVKAGEALLCQMDDDDSTYWFDGTEAWTGASEAYEKRGDWMVYEPARRYKGITDLVNQVHYDCYNFGDHYALYPGEMEARGVAIKPEEMEVIEGHGIKTSAYAYTTLLGTDEEEGALWEDAEKTAYIVDVPRGARRMRWPGIAQSSFGGIFLDKDGNNLGGAGTTDERAYEFGLFATVPEGAVKLAFCLPAEAECPGVWAALTDRIEDIEPRWLDVKERCVSHFLERLSNGHTRASGILTRDFSWQRTEEGINARNLSCLKILSYPTHRSFMRLALAASGDRAIAQRFNTEPTQSFTQINPSGMRETSLCYLGYLMGRYPYNADTICPVEFKEIHPAERALSWENEDGTVIKAKQPYNNIAVQGLRGGFFGDILPAISSTSDSTGYRTICGFENSWDSAKRFFYHAFSIRIATYTSLGFGNCKLVARMQFEGKCRWATSVSQYLAAEMIG